MALDPQTRTGHDGTELPLDLAAGTELLVHSGYGTSVVLFEEWTGEVALPRFKGAVARVSFKGDGFLGGVTNTFVAGELSLPVATTLTPASLDLFLGLVEDAPNWSGSPLVTVSPSQRGNLTDLKKHGLLQTWTDEEDGCVFAIFTDAGIALAVEHGADATLLRLP